VLKCCPGWQWFRKPGPLPSKMQLLGGLTPACLYCCSGHTCEPAGEIRQLETWHLNCLPRAAGLLTTTPYTRSYSPHPIMADAESNNTCPTPSLSTLNARFGVLPGIMMAPRKGGMQGLPEELG